MDELDLQDAGTDAGFEADSGHAVAGVGCVRLVVDNG